MAQHFQFVSAFPNPFNPSTTVHFEMQRAAQVRLSVYDIQGREVALLLNEQLSAGNHEVSWNGSSYSTGLYLIELVSSSQREFAKVLLLK